MILNVDFGLKLSNYMSQMNTKRFLFNIAISVQPPYIAGHSL